MDGLSTSGGGGDKVTEGTPRAPIPRGPRARERVLRAALERRGWIAPLAPRNRRRPYELTEPGMTALREQLPTLQRITATTAARLAGATF